MLELFDGWKFLAGLGIFLFGMFMMEESIKLLAGRSFKTLIRRYTDTRLKGLATGFVSTAILQSSSAVSLMVLAFAGAGLMTLANAIAVLMGAMVGTTCTAWVVAIFGFKIKIDAFAMPLIGIGGLGLIVLGSSSRYVNISKILAAFGFLFLGLDFMKTSVEDFSLVIDLASLPALGLWVYVLAGAILTAIMQSSSATIAIVLTTLFSGVITFDQGAAMVIGANVGTTVTVLLGAIGGVPAKKQAAASSLLFNLGTALVVYPALPLMSWLANEVFGLENNAVLGIAMFHTQFNVLGVMLFAPFIAPQTRLLERLFAEKRVVLARYIPNTSPQVPEAALAALRKEILHQLLRSFQYIAFRYRLRAEEPTADTARARPPSACTPRYQDIDRLHAEIFAFYAQMQAQAIEEKEAVQLEPVIRASRSIMNATRNLHDLHPEIADFAREDNRFMQEAHQCFQDRLEQLRTIVVAVGADPDRDSTADELAQFYDLVEDADKQFIRSCSRAVSRAMIREGDVTRLLMANRFFTQSSRMLVLSMQALTRQSGDIGQGQKATPRS